MDITYAFFIKIYIFVAVIAIMINEFLMALLDNYEYYLFRNFRSNLINNSVRITAFFASFLWPLLTAIFISLLVIHYIPQKFGKFVRKLYFEFQKSIVINNSGNGEKGD